MHSFRGGCVVALLAGAALVGGAGPAWAADLDTASAMPQAFEFVPTASQVSRAASRQQGWQRCGSRDKWEFDFAIPVWIPGVSGSFASGGIEIEPEQDAGDILEDLDSLFDVFTELQFGFLGSFQARKNRWTLSLDGFGARLGAGIDFRLTDGRLIDARLWAIVIRGAVKYDVVNCPVRLPCLGRGSFRAALVAGARYWGAGFKATLPLGIELKDSEQWVDPVVGLDLRLEVSRKIQLHAEGDVGGFGLGSNIAWWLSLGVEWRFASRWTLIFGYAFLETDYGTTDDFAYRVHLRGPVLGIRYSF